MPVISAGLLLFRWRAAQLEVLLVHPGGPYWEQRDAGAWSIPKGEVERGEDARSAALREFREETGFLTVGETLPLGQAKQPSGKVIIAWAMAGDADLAQLTSNSVTIEWPPRSGRQREIPEVDKAEWFDLTEARGRIQPGQVYFIDALASLFAAGGTSAETP